MKNNYLIFNFLYIKYSLAYLSPDKYYQDLNTSTIIYFHIKMSDLNTSKKSQTPMSSSFQITMNQVEVFDDVREYIESLKPFQYGIACQEIAPTTGHKHIHMFVQFTRGVRLSLNKLMGTHVEKCKGSPQQNVDYIKKDGDIIWERGEMKKKGGYTIQQVKKMPIEQRDKLPITYYNIVQKINNEEKKYIKGTEYYKDVRVTYIWGESGVGKTKYVIEEIGDKVFNEVKYDGNFWLGATEDCDIALYDDFRDTHMKTSEFINFIDYNRHIMNVKNGAVRNNYKEIYITSVQSPDEIYKNVQGEPRKQWLRRMNVVHIGEKIGECWEELINSGN